MAKIYKCSDRIKIKIDEVVITIAPLSYDQKVDAQNDIVTGHATKDYKLINQGIIKAVKYGLKDISGLEDSSGNQYKLESEMNVLTDECISDLFNIELHDKLVIICTSLMKGIPSEFTDQNGKKIEGVEILPSESNGKSLIPNV